MVDVPENDEYRGITKTSGISLPVAESMKRTGSEGTFRCCPVALDPIKVTLIIVNARQRQRRVCWKHFVSFECVDITVLLPNG
ncbi:MAG TPA: hypothetical protein VLL54_13350 [Pyrinomonadaceae bacterium]|nr:hypothetical protein [Pyrinomonadaceae bacterium]